MKGSRALLPQEISAILASIESNRFPLRDRALLILGLRTGFRISELLSLTVADVLQNGNYTDRITVAKRNMKRQTAGRTVLLHPEARQAIANLVGQLANSDPRAPLFKSREGSSQALGRKMAWVVLTKAYKKCGLTGKLGTHCMRKSFAKTAYEFLKRDLIKTQKALGHASITSTVEYLSFADEEIEDVFLKS